MQQLAARQGFDPTSPSTASIAELKTAADRLETSVSKLMTTLPDTDAVRLHVAMLPHLQEVVAAARDVIDVAESRDEAAQEAALAWLDEALLRANAELRWVVKHGS